VKNIVCFRVFFNLFYFYEHQKGSHLWQRGAIQWGATEVCWGQLPQTAPTLDPPLVRNQYSPRVDAEVTFYTWILVGNGSHTYKMLWTPPEFS